MFRRKSKIFGLIALAVAFTFMFSAVASAAVPVNLYFKSGDEMVKVDYAKAVSDAQDEDSTLYEAVVEKIGEAEGSGAAVVVETDEGIFLDWQKALMKSARFAEIVDDETYKTAKPEYTKELQVKDGEAIIDDPIGEIVDDALKVISVSDIDAVEVEFGASIEDVMALLPPTVTATLNNEEATEVELEINWEENGDYNGEEAGDYVFEGALVAEEDAEYTIPEEYAAVEVTVIVLEEGVVELRVVGVSAINRTTIEATLNEEADAEAAADVASYTVTVGDKTVEVKAVAYDEDTNVATLTVADMKNLVGVVAVNGVEGDAVDYTVEAAVINGEATATEVPVGRDVDVTFTVEDMDGDLMQGADVRIRALELWGDLIYDFGVLKTNEKGQVTATYGNEVLDANTILIRAVVVNKPVLKAEVSVDWTDVRDDLISIDQLGKATLPTTDVGNDENVRTYTVTFKDAYGQPLAAGEEVFVEVKGLDVDGTTAIDNTNIGTYVDLAKSGKLTSAYGGAVANVFGYKLTAADNGKITFKLVGQTGNEGTLTPTFYYGDPAIANADVVVKAGTTTFVDRVFSQENSRIEAKGAAVVAVGSAREYVVTAKDQFGADFVGTLKFTFVEDEDGLAKTTPGSIAFNPAGPAILLAADEGVLEFELDSGLDKESATPIVWFDTDGSGSYSEDQAQLVGEKVTFDSSITPTVNEITLTTENASASITGAVIFKAEFFDQFGNAIVPGANEVVFQAFEADDLDTALTLNASASKVTIELDPTKTGFATVPGAVTAYAVTPTNKALLVKFESDTAGEYVIRAFIDVDGDGKLQADEYVIDGETIVIEAIKAAEMKFNTQSAFGTDNNGVDYEIQLLDQDGTAYDASAAGNSVDVTYTIKNTGDVDLTASDASSTVIKAGETKTVTVTVSAVSGQDTITLTPDSAPDEDNAVSATVTVSATGIDSISVSTVWVAVDATASGDDAYNGTVIAYDLDNTWYVIETAVGNIEVDYTAGSTSDAYKVNGNTANQIVFEKGLATGVTIEYVDLDGFGTIVHKLTK